MKNVMLLLLATLSLSAQATDIKLFANINVVESDSVVSTSTSATGSMTYDVDTYSSEKTFIIGSSTFNGISQQIVARVDGCNLIGLNTKNLLLRISNKPNIYSSYWSQTTYKMSFSTRQECMNVQRLIRSAQFDKPINLKLDGANKSVALVPAQ